MIGRGALRLPHGLRRRFVPDAEDVPLPPSDDARCRLGALAAGESAPHAILDRQPRGGSPFVFPSPLDPARPRCANLSIWYRVRRDACIEAVRLLDLRHTFASQAVLEGVPLPVVSRLLGHSSPQMTLRYAHFADRDIEAAAERVGSAVSGLMTGGESESAR